MGEYKYGTNFTSVKVKYAPGGASSINLGWDDTGSTSKNSEKRQAVKDPFKSREGNRNPYETEDHQIPDKYMKPPAHPGHSGHANQAAFPSYAAPPSYQHGQIGANPTHSRYQQHSPQPDNRFPVNPSYSQLQNTGKNEIPSQFEEYKAAELIPSQNYFQNKEESQFKPIDFPSNNYFRQQDPGNYFHQPEPQKMNAFSAPQNKNPIYGSQGQFLMEKNFGKGQDVNFKESEKVYAHKEQAIDYGHRESPIIGGGAGNNYPAQKFSQPQRFGMINEPPIDAFSGLGIRQNPGDESRQQGNFQVKNSVKVSNPPGGQSSFVFG